MGMYRIIIFVFLFGAQLLSAQTYWLRVVPAEPLKLNYPNKRVGEKEHWQVLESLLADLRSKGMLEASIDSSFLSGDTLLAYLHVGKVYKWAKLSAGNLEEGARSASGLREKLFRNAVLNPLQVSKLLKKTLVYYQNNGYPFASVGFDSVQLEGIYFRASVKATTGDRFLVDSLNHRGDARISKTYLENYLGIKPGDLYRENLISAIQTRLKEIPFVQVYRPPDVFLTGRSALIRLYLNNRKASNFSGIIGVLPNSTNGGKLLITGEANLKVKNGLGRGESIDAEWRRLQAATQSLNVAVAWPFLFNTPFGVSGKFNLYKKDTSFINVQPHLGLLFSMRGTDYLKAFYEMRSSALLSTRGLSHITTLPDFADVSNSLYGLEVHLNRLDYRYNPRKGYQILTRLSAGRKRIKKNANVNPAVYQGLKLNTNQLSALLEADLFVPLFKRATFRTGLLGSWMQGQTLFENELPRIGGLNSLRGFNEESIFASSYAIVNLEYRYLFEENAYLFGFVNGAWYENRAVNRNLSDLPYGFGAGISFETKAGIFSVSYALGSEHQQPVQFRTAKVHFGLSNLF